LGELADRGPLAWYTRGQEASLVHRASRRPPPKRGPSLLPDSLTARASFTHGFPYYPNPNLPMALRPVVNRCANSTLRIDRLFSLDKGFRGLVSFTKQSASPDQAPESARGDRHHGSRARRTRRACAPTQVITKWGRNVGGSGRHPIVVCASALEIVEQSSKVVVGCVSAKTADSQRAEPSRPRWVRLTPRATRRDRPRS